MESGKINANAIITHRINFNEVTCEFEKLYNYGGNLVKAVIELD